LPLLPVIPPLADHAMLAAEVMATTMPRESHVRKGERFEPSIGTS
jgi:hypothetical protein